MKYIIGKNIRVVEPTQAIIDYCNNKLTLANPDYIIANRLGRYVGKMDKSICLYVKNGNDLILPYGCLADIWKIGYGATYELRFSNFKGSNLKGSINLYDYQERAVNALKSGKNGVLEAPCGSGKTQIGLALIKSIGGKALWLTHTHKLLEQSMARAKAYFDGDFGTITEGKVNIGNDITFATVQTMRELDVSVYENEFDIIIIDECHRCVGTPTKVMQFYKVVSNCNARYKYGLSATLSRADNMISCVYSIIGKKLHTITKQEVGSKIIKAQHIKIDVDLDYDIYDYCNSDGTLNYSLLITTLSNDSRRNDLIIDNVIKVAQKGKKQLILCSRICQINYISKILENKGYNVACITGLVKDKNRNYNCDVIVATYALAKEGLDIPDLDVVHFATPQKDKITVKQSAGRVERNIEGKEQPFIYDYVDNNISYCVSCYNKRVNILKK